MKIFFVQLWGEFCSASSSKKLGMIADVVSILGLSLAAVLGATILQLIRKGSINWGGVGLIAAGSAFSLAVVVAVHGSISMFRPAAFLSVFGRVCYYLIVFALWTSFFAIVASLLPEAIEQLVLHAR